jgi:sigma-B regulation protein RsbU (phosphoserine phosphatase)
MEVQNITIIKEQLVERRGKLQQVINNAQDPAQLSGLLQQVDDALERIGDGTYGICTICHEDIGNENLMVNPLLTICLSHMDRHQLQALQSDLEFAGQIQRGLLPENNVNMNGWDFSYHYRPAGIVSGDFCDMIPVGDDSFAFVLGDVSGKGVSASLMVSHLHALIRSLLSFGLPVIEIVKRANGLFRDSVISSNYATLVFGKASSKGEVELCIAGHNPPLMAHDGKVTHLKATGIPVGLFCDSEYGVHKLQLDKDDFILLYTDGLTEAAVDKVEYGEERLCSQLVNRKSNHPQELINDLLTDHKKFLSNSKPGDDITLAVIRRS